jgi:hypothetical protein
MRHKAIALVVLALSCCLSTSSALAGYYPGRPTFDYNKAGNGDCDDPSNPAADHGRCGSLDGPVFNSFINTPSYGDERYFFDGHIAEATERGSHADPLHLGAAPAGQRITLRVYVNNGANEHYGTRTTAHNARVTIALPNVAGASLRAVAHVSAQNATPPEVEDTLDFVASRAFGLRYVPGSAVQFQGDERRKLSDEIITNGVLVGDDRGEFKAGFDQAALVEAQLEVIDSPKVSPGPGTPEPLQDEPDWAIRAIIGVGIFVALIGLLLKFRRKIDGISFWRDVISGLVVAGVAALASTLIAWLLGK